MNRGRGCGRELRRIDVVQWYLMGVKFESWRWSLRHQKAICTETSVRSAVLSNCLLQGVGVVPDLPEHTHKPGCSGCDTSEILGQRHFQSGTR